MLSLKEQIFFFLFEPVNAIWGQATTQLGDHELIQDILIKSSSLHLEQFAPKYLVCIFQKQ